MVCINDSVCERMVRQARALSGSPCEHDGEPCYGCATCFARETVAMLDAEEVKAWRPAHDLEKEKQVLAAVREGAQQLRDEKLALETQLAEMKEVHAWAIITLGTKVCVAEAERDAWRKNWGEEATMRAACLIERDKHIAKIAEAGARVTKLEAALQALDDDDRIGCLGEAACATYAPCVTCQARETLQAKGTGR